MARAPVLRSAVGRLQQRSAPAGQTLALSALRSRLDDASEGARWALHPDGVLGRALIQPAATVVSFPLTLTGEVTLTTRAMLMPHDWRDLHGTIHAQLAATSPDGQQHQLWSATLRASDRGRPRGHAISCQLPASTTSLQLTATPGTGHTPAVKRMLWVNPTITDPNATPPPTPQPTPPAPNWRPPPGPLISVLMPVHDPPPQMLEEAIASVRAQTFQNWELRLVDDGSTNPQIHTTLERHATSDPRIHLHTRDHAGGISTATNTALQNATGQYIALLDHDDTLTPDALQHVADQITTQPNLDMIYTDEDVVGDHGLIESHPKPGWSPEHMAALMYTCHLGVYRRELAVELGGFDGHFDGCQDYDFVLRLVERSDRIAHIPRILYHWRAHATSTAGGDQAKPYAYLAQPGAIANHLQRSEIDAEVQFGQLPGLHRIVHRVDRATSVEIVLAVNDAGGLQEAAASWNAQPHTNWRVLLAAPTHHAQAATNALKAAGIPEHQITTLAHDDPRTALAAAAQAATAQHLLLTQTPITALTHDWLTRLLGYSAQPGIAAAGPILLSTDGRIQQAGIALPNGIPLHLHYGSHLTAAPPVVYNLSAVSGALVTRRETYHQLGGIDPELKDLALIDYCLRATNTGQRIVIVPDARLRTTGPDTTTNDLPTIWQLRDKWAQTHNHDPYYNPNYRTDRGDLILA